MQYVCVMTHHHRHDPPPQPFSFITIFAVAALTPRGLPSPAITLQGVAAAAAAAATTTTTSSSSSSTLTHRQAPLSPATSPPPRGQRCCHLQVVTFLQEFFNSRDSACTTPYSLLLKSDFGLFSSGGSGAIELCIAAVADPGAMVVVWCWWLWWWWWW
jgi:hypothetical protein